MTYKHASEVYAKSAYLRRIKVTSLAAPTHEISLKNSYGQQ